MTPESIIRQAQADGVTIALSSAGTIKAIGEPAAVNRWLPQIREHKPGIVAALGAAANDAPRSDAAGALIRKREIPQSAGRATAKTAERNPTAVTAVPEPGDLAISQVSFGSNGSAPAADFQKTEIAIPMTAGDETAIRRWLDSIGESDPEIVADVLARCRADSECRRYFVTRAAESVASARIDRVIAKLDRDPTLNMALETHPDDMPGVVIVAVAIRGKAACELHVPADRWNPFTLLELIETHATRGTLQ